MCCVCVVCVYDCVCVVCVSVCVTVCVCVCVVCVVCVCVCVWLCVTLVCQGVGVEGVGVLLWFPRAGMDFCFGELGEGAGRGSVVF